MRNCLRAGTSTGVGIEACSPSADPLRIELRAVADRLVDIRRQLKAWLERVGVSGAAAVNEACTNCIEHGYRDVDTGVIQVEATLEEGRIVICVADFGFWRTPPVEPSTRGRGLPIIDAMSDDVQLDSSTSGTTVKISFDARPQDCGSRTT